MSLTTVHTTESSEWSVTDQSWCAIGPSARVELRASAKKPLSGWVLFRANLKRENIDFTNKLIVQTKTTTIEFDISIKSDGTISELCYFPEDINAIFLQTMASTGRFSLQNVALTSVGVVERLIRMWARVGAMYRTHSRQRREHLGIRFHAPLVDLSRSYRVLSRLRSYSAELPYADWIKEFDHLSIDDIKRITAIIPSWKRQAKVTVLVVANSPIERDCLQQTLDSLSNQLYQNTSIVLLLHAQSDAETMAFSTSDQLQIITPLQRTDWCGGFNSALKSLDPNDLVLTIRPGTVLSTHALFWFVAAALANESSRVFYADHDYLDARTQRFNPIFKPDWSREYLRSTHYIGDTVAITIGQLVASDGLVLDDAGRLNLYDLHLRSTERAVAGSIVHIPAILSHSHSGELSLHKDKAVSDNDRNIVAAHLDRLNISAGITTTEYGHNRLHYKLPNQRPKISIIIPTRDMLKFVRPCVESILGHSTYPDYEIIIVDNQSVEPATQEYFQSLSGLGNVRVLAFNQPFNFSAMNNFAVEHAKGEVVCLLNNDTKVITPAWMEEMLGHLLQENVGVVGVKLYFSDDRVQHAGVVVGPGGCASHLHSHLQHSDRGYCDRAVVSQNVSAVTAACLMTHKSLYQSLDGLNEKDLAVEFNDVDYCLRVRSAGYEVVYTPHAELYHYESVSRGQDFTSEDKKQARRREADFLRRQWTQVIKHDPFYNPNLTRVRADFTLSHAPLVDKPWHDVVVNNHE